MKPDDIVAADCTLLVFGVLLFCCSAVLVFGCFAVLVCVDVPTVSTTPLLLLL